jgi:opacity protein-like surface antigen
VFVRGLAGAGVVDGAVPVSDTSYFHGWLVRPAYTGGAGVERSVSENLAVRVNGDYVRTTFFDGAGAAQAQNNLRLTVSVVFRLKEHRRRYSSQVR